MRRKTPGCLCSPPAPDGSASSFRCTRTLPEARHRGPASGQTAVFKRGLQCALFPWLLWPRSYWLWAAAAPERGSASVVPLSEPVPVLWWQALSEQSSAEPLEPSAARQWPAHFGESTCTDSHGQPAGIPRLGSIVIVVEIPTTAIITSAIVPSRRWWQRAKRRSERKIRAKAGRGRREWRGQRWREELRVFGCG